MWDVSKFLENQEIDEGVSISNSNQSGLVFTTYLYFSERSIKTTVHKQHMFPIKKFSVNGYAVQ